MLIHSLLKQKDKRVEHYRMRKKYWKKKSNGLSLPEVMDIIGIVGKHMEFMLGHVL